MTRALQQKILYLLASRALKNAHPVKSNFKVGAAGLAVGKHSIPRLVTGWNNESRHGDSIHAEESMVAKLRKGEMLLRVVILGENKMSLAPCGNCREVLISRSAEDAEALVQTSEGVNEWLLLKDLLPNKYTAIKNIANIRGFLSAKTPNLSEVDLAPLGEYAKDLLLFNAALEILNNCPYIPHLKERRAAALMTENGSIFAATNKDDAAYHHDLAIENVLALADSDRTRNASTALFMHDSEVRIFPDGRSRQKLYEASQVSGTDFKIISASTSGKLWYSTVSKLLPYTFGPKDLGIDVSKYL
jgi:cytidine deaminase